MTSIIRSALYIRTLSKVPCLYMEVPLYRGGLIAQCNSSFKSEVTCLEHRSKITCKMVHSNVESTFALWTTNLKSTIKQPTSCPSMSTFSEDVSFFPSRIAWRPL